jgi:hypothetical protein
MPSPTVSTRAGLLDRDLGVVALDLLLDDRLISSALISMAARSLLEALT